jgi:hypothetical protein
MRNIGFVDRDLNCRLQWNRHRPGKLFPGRLDGAGRARRRLLRNSRRRHTFSFNAWRGVNNRPGQIPRLRVNHLPLLINRLRLDVPSPLEAVPLNRYTPCRFPTFNIRCPHRPAQQLHQLQIELGDGERCYIRESCHAMPKAKRAANSAPRANNSQNRPKSPVNRELNLIETLFPDAWQTVPFMTDDAFPKHHFPNLWTTNTITG